MKIELTEQELSTIFDIAHREWLEDTGHSGTTTRPSRFLLARSYFMATISFLRAKGYTIEMKNDEKPNEG